jgi:uncharacterized membrane protein YbaN (DUF454 family)
MSVHKVPQDVEAEDKLVGPFTFKQLVLLLAAGLIGFLMVMLSRISIFLALIPLPVFLVLLFFGIYRRKDQSVETYVAALLRFYFKPRKRIWDKDGILETVIITAPKQIQVTPIDNMNNNEVRTRLQTLGQLMDSRGWSTKNVGLQDGSMTMAMEFTPSDRLVMPNIPAEPSEIHDSDDMLNNYANPAASTIAAKTSAMQEKAREEAMQKMQQLSQTTAAAPAPQIQASDDQTTQDNPASSSVMTTDVDPDILRLSTTNDRSVASIAKEADEILETDVTISLHGR